MKKLASFILLSAAMMTAGLYGCQQPENEEKPGKVTVFELTQDTVTVAAEGGEASIGYKLEEPQEGATVQPSYEADWLGDFDASVEGTITFNVAANETDTKREAEVVVTYADLKDSFVVVQNAAGGGDEPEPTEAAFEITVDSTGCDKILVSVVPLDKEGTYDMGAITRESLNTFPEDIMFVEEYLVPFYQSQADAAGMTVEELMSQWLLKGDQSRVPIAGLSPESTYYVYCVGLTTSLEITTELVKYEFTSAPLGEFDAQIDVTVEGPKATVKITPADDQTGYYSAVFDGVGHDEDVLIASVQGALESAAAQLTMWGMSYDAAIAAVTKWGETTQEYDLAAEMEYTAAAISVGTSGVATSRPVVKEFVTGKTAQSDNVITVDYTLVSGRKVEFDVNVTVPDDPYVFFFYQYTDDFKAMSEEEIIQYIIDNENMNSYTRRGSVSSYEEALTPETEYVIYAFGYAGGSANTELFTSTVTTTEEVLNDCVFSYDYGPYYNGTEAAEKYPTSLSQAVGRVVLPATYVVEGEYTAAWHNVFQGDVTDPSDYPDEYIYQNLRHDGYTWLNKGMIYILDFGQEYTLCGFAETVDGNFSVLYREKIGPFTLEGCSPIDGLVGEGLQAPRFAMPAPRDYVTAPMVQENMNDGLSLRRDESSAGIASSTAQVSEVLDTIPEEEGIRIFTRQ